jgi:hypothetical protein
MGLTLGPGRPIRQIALRREDLSGAEAPAQALVSAPGRAGAFEMVRSTISKAFVGSLGL